MLCDPDSFSKPIINPADCSFIFLMNIIWDNVFKNGLSKICRRQDFKNLNAYGLLQADHTPSNLKAAFHKFHLVHFWIIWLTW